MKNDELNELTVRLDGLEDTVDKLQQLVLKLEVILEDIASYIIPKDEQE